MVKVTGKSEVNAYIGGIEARLKPILVAAAKVGAAVISKEIAAQTPSQAVRDALQTKVKTADGMVTARISLKTAWARSLGNWLEYGTSPHFITVDDAQRGGKSVRKINDESKEGSLVIGGKFVGSTVFHPGAQAHPSFRPALDLKEQEAIAAAQKYINEAVLSGKIVEVGA